MSLFSKLLGGNNADKSPLDLLKNAAEAVLSEAEKAAENAKKAPQAAPQQGADQQPAVIHNRRARRAQEKALAAAGEVPKAAPTGPVTTVVKDKNDPWANPERNKPCPCGSGLKYKKCHGKGL